MMVKKRPSLFGNDGTRTEDERTSRDMTDRERADELRTKNDKLQRQLDKLNKKLTALQKSDDKFRAFTDNIPDLTIISDARGVYTYVSPSVGRIAGCKPEEFVGKKTGGIASALGIHPDGIELLTECRHRAMQSPGVPIPVPPIRGHAQDGRTIYAEGTVTYLPKVRGIQGVVFHGHDITDKKQAEEALREREDMYRTLVEDSTDWVWAMDLEGITTYSNPAVYELLGYQVSEIVGTNIFPIIHPDDQEHLLKTLAETLESSKHKPVTRTVEGRYVIEERWIHKDGSVRSFESSITPILDTDGQLIGFRGVDRDITERKRADEALLQANKKLTMLNSITRHDILNQISAAVMYLALIEEMCSDPEMLGYVQKIGHLTELMKKQIAFTRDYQDIGTRAPAWQVLFEVINTAIRQLKPSGVEVNVDVSGMEIFADLLMEKVFYNLMENSLRHGGHVTSMNYFVQETENGLVITYCDNGVGIIADDKKKLFQKGFGKNTGLGLFLSREILSITGMTITEHGEPGNGVKFEIMVPKGMWRRAESETIGD